jgi:hypothetical protein
MYLSGESLRADEMPQETNHLISRVDHVVRLALNVRGIADVTEQLLFNLGRSR